MQNAGDSLVFDYVLFQRGGANRSGGIRCGLNHVYSMPFTQQLTSIPKAMNGEWISHRDLGKLLGCEWEPAGSAFDWHKRQLAKLVD